MLLSVVIAILFFGFIIFLHELGHFLAARSFGVTVHEFAVGMGPTLVSKKSKKTGTLYSLRALPFGGYVSMAGEDEDSEDPGAFCNQKKSARFIILFAGAFMNLLLGFVLMLFCVGGAKQLYSNTIQQFLVLDETGQPVTDYQGLQVGDQLLAVNGMRLHVRYDYLFAAMRAQDTPSTLALCRNGEKLTVSDFVFPTLSEDGELYGNPNFFMPAVKEKTVFSVLYDTCFQTASVVKMVVVSLYDVITGRYGAGAVSGPVGVVQEVQQTVHYGPLALMFLISMITINIGVFNLIPFPALDGGRLVFILLELLLRRPVNKKTENFINFMGLVLLFGVMLMITFKDILRLIV